MHRKHALPTTYFSLFPRAVVSHVLQAESDASKASVSVIGNTIAQRSCIVARGSLRGANCIGDVAWLGCTNQEFRISITFMLLLPENHRFSFTFVQIADHESPSALQSCSMYTASNGAFAVSLCSFMSISGTCKLHELASRNMHSMLSGFFRPSK